MIVRREKLDKLRALGIDPFPHKFERSHVIPDLKQGKERLVAEKLVIRTAGRILTLRRQGKTSFAHILDFEDRIQIYVRQDQLGEKNYETFKLLDIGDIIGVGGYLFYTHSQELTVHVNELQILAKALRPLPVVKEKEVDGKKVYFDQLADTDFRYRHRYLDLIVNPEVRQVFVKRTRIIHAIRQFLNNQGFYEVETPMLQPLYGGAFARPFKTHHHALNMPLYLKVSPELYLKRLIVGGLEKVYELNKNFRNEGIDRTHNPEFSMLEVYQAYATFEDMMKLTEQLIGVAAGMVHAGNRFNYQDQSIDLNPPWRRLTLIEALKEYAGIDVEGMSETELRKRVQVHGLEAGPAISRGLLINNLFEEIVEAKLIQPTFITHYPRETTPLCKSTLGQPELIDRFELFIQGWEIANAYSELNDPILQRTLFEEQAKHREIEGEVPPVDEDFLRAVEYGMPPTGGLGIGIDRLIILLTNQQSIRDIVFFPHMKPESSAVLSE